MPCRGRVRTVEHSAMSSSSGKLFARFESRFEIQVGFAECRLGVTPLFVVGVAD